MLGRGVDAPMPVILLGAPGGMASAGILGMFVGATALAVGYQIFMGWVATRRRTTSIQDTGTMAAKIIQQHRTRWMTTLPRSNPSAWARN